MIRPLLAAMALLPAMIAPALAGTVRTMTFNIRFDTSQDGVNAWPHRRAAVIALIRFYAPDVLGLQEALPHQRAQLEADLPDYVLMGVGRDDGAAKGEMAPLAFRAARFQLQAQGSFFLSPTPDRPLPGWDAALPRPATWARLTDRESGARLLALNTHFDHVGQVARLESARLLRAWLQAHRQAEESVILLGDLNAPPGEASYQWLTAPGPGALQDTRAASETPPLGPAGTFTGFDIARADAAPIDYIFTSPPVRVLRHGVLTQHDGGRLPSDHYPVIADIVLPDESH